MDVRNGRSLSLDSVKFKLGKTSKFQILNILFWTMDLNFLESAIIDYLVWSENYTVYVVWNHNRDVRKKDGNEASAINRTLDD